MHEFSNAVVDEAVSKGLDVQRVISSRRKSWNGRLVLIENRPCQIVRTAYQTLDERWPEAIGIRLYLPRTDWADFIIYVARKATTQPLEFYVVPRGVLSKDTEFSPHTLEKYRDAWNLLSKRPSPNTARRFRVLNWQVQDAMDAAKKAGLWSALIGLRKKRRWPLFFQTRLIIAGRKCALHSLSRLSQNPDNRFYNCVWLRKPKGNPAEFNLYMLRGSGNSSDSGDSAVYVFPHGAIMATTSISLNNERLAAYKNNWGLLSQPAGAPDETSAATEWKPKVQKEQPIKFKKPTLPKELPLAVRETMFAAEKYGLRVEFPHPWSTYRIHISGKRCQIMHTKLVAMNNASFVPLNKPTSDWAEYVIFFVRPDADAATGDFYIVPRAKLTKRTMVSPASSWLREYACAWHLLKSGNSTE